MQAEPPGSADLRTQADDLRSGGPSRGRADNRVYLRRRRISGGLLIFITVVGLPIVLVPALRQRLSERAQELREAMAGMGKPTPIVAIVGENRDPLPEEYEHPPQIIPRPSGIVYLPDRVYDTGTGSGVYGSVAEQDQAAFTVSEPEPGSEQSGQPEYRQGEIEREAYDKLLQSSATVAGMVQGSNPALRFKGWDAARIEEDTLYVRLTFAKSPGDAEMVYIWQVKLQAKTVMPLNYNARSLPK